MTNHNQITLDLPSNFGSTWFIHTQAFSQQGVQASVDAHVLKKFMKIAPNPSKRKMSIQVTF